MYRTILPVLWAAIAAAPQNSDITFVKTQRPAINGTQSNTSYIRESRIENIPLTIPGNFDSHTDVNNDHNDSHYDPGHILYSSKAADEPRISFGNANKSSTTENTLTKADDDIELEKENVFNKSLNEAKEIKSELKDKALPKTVENDSSRHVRSEFTTVSFESETELSTEPVTVRDDSVDELLRQTDEYELRTRAPAPRFLSKLSYFQKTNDFTPSVTRNFIERASKRKFKSKCRCEKIWNCPKLQITVPRCPNEYFLCCF